MREVMTVMAKDTCLLGTRWPSVSGEWLGQAETKAQHCQSLSI